MKKFISLILVAIMCLPLVSCGRSENAKSVDKKIHSLNEITIENADFFEEIENEYEQLTEEEKDSLKYAQTLNEKRTQLAQDFAEKLSVIFDTVLDRPNSVKIHNCWYAKNPDTGVYYFTYYISAEDRFGSGYEYWGNMDFGFNKLTEDVIEYAISNCSYYNRFWSQDYMFKYDGKTAFEMDCIELDAEAIQDFYLKRP